MSKPLRMAALAAALSLCAPVALAHDGVHVHDPYARSAAGAASGAAFMVIDNHGAADDRLIAARSDIAARVELHTHEQDAQGVMRMIHVEEGFVIPAGGEIALERGGKHVMFLGLHQPLETGDVVPLTLVFENEGEVMLEVVVDNERSPDHHGHDHGHGHDHSHGHDHGHGHGN